MSSRIRVPPAAARTGGFYILKTSQRYLKFVKKQRHEVFNGFECVYNGTRLRAQGSGFSLVPCTVRLGPLCISL